jgi:2'-5' RNA ligase
MKPRYDPRVFLALTLSRTAHERLAIVQEELRQYLQNWHYIPQLNFHVTLRFFGEVPPETLEQIRKAARLIGPHVPNFTLNWNKVEFFGSPRNARVLFAGADDCRELNRLAEIVGKVFPEDRDDARGFAPHVTLAKARKQMDPDQARINANMLGRLREHGRIGPDPLSVDFKTVHREFVLMETIWVGRVVEYSVIDRFPLSEQASLL